MKNHVAFIRNDYTSYLLDFTLLSNGIAAALNPIQGRWLLISKLLHTTLTLLRAMAKLAQTDRIKPVMRSIYSHGIQNTGGDRQSYYVVD